MANYYLAGDISKEKIDFCLYDGKNYLLTRAVNNNKAQLKNFVKEIQNFMVQVTENDLPNEIICVFEHTGIYNNHVVDLLCDLKFKVALIHPGTLKAVVKVDRNKTDVIDAKRIAEYANRFEDKLDYVSFISTDLAKLKTLISERGSLVKIRSQITCKTDDNQKFLTTTTHLFLKKNIKGILEELNEAIQNLEKEIIKIIKLDDDLKQNYFNALSVPGIGPVTAAALICYTANFTKFKSAKQLGSYCGVVPFERSSGIYKGKQRVSPKANKQLKSLLHMGALSISSCNNHFGQYYKRKVEEGKNKMSALNALRNKVLKTVFACVKNKTEYRPDFHFTFAA